jgi:hypothetical protein
MRFDERDEGDFRIYVGAIESPHGDGYNAAVSVRRMHGAAQPDREIWRDDNLACGHRWATAEAALHYAMARALEVVRSRADALAC